MILDCSRPYFDHDIFSEHTCFEVPRRDWTLSSSLVMFIQRSRVNQLPIELPIEELTLFCDRWKVTTLELFGSVLRDDFSPDSDVDLLLAFEPDSTPSLFEWVGMKDELEAIFGRAVDVLTRKSVEKSTNPYRREEILKSTRVIYERKAA